MQSIRRKFFAVFLVVTMLAASCMLFACNGTDNKIKITVGIWRGTTAYEKKLYEECASAFEAKYPQYEIVSSPYVYSSDSVVGKYASGQLPTLFQVDVSYLGGALASGYVRDVSEPMREYGWTDKADGYFLSQLTFDGKVGGVPCEQYSCGMVLNLPLLHNAGVLDKADNGNYLLYDESGNALYPDTFDKLRQACAAVQRVCGNDTYGLFLPSGDEECGKVYADIVYNFGTDNLEVTDNEGNVSLKLDTDYFTAALRWVKAMAQEGYVDDSQAYATDDWVAEMSQNKAAIAFCQSSVLYGALLNDSELADKIAFVPMPNNGSTTRSVWSGKAYCIGGKATDEQMRGAFEFLRFWGDGPEANVNSTYFAEKRYALAAAEKSMVVARPWVWDDVDYRAYADKLVNRYGNANQAYFAEFNQTFDIRKRADEPYCAKQLRALLDEMFAEMLFRGNDTDIVKYVGEQQKAFTERYLADINNVAAKKK